MPVPNLHKYLPSAQKCFQNLSIRPSKLKPRLAPSIGYILRREIERVWPLLTVGTEASGNSRSTYERFLPWLVRWARHANTRDFVLPWLLKSSYNPQHIFSSPHTILLHLSPWPSKLGRQSYRVAFLLIGGNLPHMFSEVEHLESRLNQYDDLLEHIR
jgi:hypothetical protein